MSIFVQLCWSKHTAQGQEALHTRTLMATGSPVSLSLPFLTTAKPVVWGERECLCVYQGSAFGHSCLCLAFHKSAANNTHLPRPRSRPLHSARGNPGRWLRREVLGGGRRLCAVELGVCFVCPSPAFPRRPVYALSATHKALSIDRELVVSTHTQQQLQVRTWLGIPPGKLLRRPCAPSLPPHAALFCSPPVCSRSLVLLASPRKLPCCCGGADILCCCYCMSQLSLLCPLLNHSATAQSIILRVDIHVDLFHF